jgi:sugar lactone lactonase YvrE
MRTKLLGTCFALSIVVVAGSAGAPPPALQYYAAAIEARDAEDYLLYIRNMESALEESPGHAILMRHLAQGHALAGQPDSARVWLERLADTGAWFDLTAYEELAGLVSDPGFRQVTDRVEENRRPSGEATVAFRVPDPLLVPEGVAYDPGSGTFYLSSVRQRKIVGTDGTGKSDDFAGEEAGLFCGLGLKVDDTRRQLWAVSAAFPGMEGYTDELKGCSTLSCFDLETGDRLRHVALVDPDAPHAFGDLVVDGEGRVYVTDAVEGGVFVLDPGAEEMRKLLPPGTLHGPNGIALDGDRDLLYVAQYNLDVIVVDLADGSVHPLPRPSDLALYGVDGLYLYRNSLIAVQNHPSLDRVARFFLAEDGLSLTGWETLVARDPRFEEPTTGTLVGNRFLFIANSQIEKMSHADSPDPGDFEETILLEIDLSGEE